MTFVWQFYFLIFSIFPCMFVQSQFLPYFTFLYKLLLIFRRWVISKIWKGKYWSRKLEAYYEIMAKKKVNHDYSNMPLNFLSKGFKRLPFLLYSSVKFICNFLNKMLVLLNLISVRNIINYLVSDNLIYMCGRQLLRWPLMISIPLYSCPQVILSPWVWAGLNWLLLIEYKRGDVNSKIRFLKRLVSAWVLS